MIKRMNVFFFTWGSALFNDTKTIFPKIRLAMGKNLRIKMEEYIGMIAMLLNRKPTLPNTIKIGASVESDPIKMKRVLIPNTEKQIFFRSPK